MTDLRSDEVVARIWRRDSTLWKPEPDEISNRLGWLTLPAEMRPRLDDVQAFAEQVAADGFTDVLLLGMGGSSLGAEVIRTALGRGRNGLELTVLDTTHPDAIAAVEDSLDLERTLFLVASKSGGTIETRSHLEYFWATHGDGSRFVAITDEGSGLDALARERGFRATFRNPPDVGGRYSVLSLFGLVPGALIGADLSELLDDASHMARLCRHDGEDNPGAALGVALGHAAQAGADKMTLLLPAALGSLGAWIEQLVAESTGKEGTGIVPIVGEAAGDPRAYGTDRVFVSVGVLGELLDDLERAGHRVIRLSEKQTPPLGAEFFRWCFATAVAGWSLGINPFDQPNVEEAKRATGEILGGGARGVPVTEPPESLLLSISAGDYVALQAYLAPSSRTDDRLDRIRTAIRDRHRVATTVGYGPRFLHSTGQLHKGGGSGGVFFQIVDEHRATDRDIPSAGYTFGRLLDAQADGDLTALATRGRRVARTTLGRLEEAMR